MRFAVTGEWTRNRALAMAIAAFAAFASLQVVTGTLLYFQAMSLDPATVVAHYLGDEASFRPARTLRGMLEATHFHAFAMGLQLLTLGHLVFFTSWPRAVQVGLVASAFASALASEGAGWLVWGVSPAFAPLKVLAFVALQASQVAMIVAVLSSLVQSARSSNA